MFPCITPVIVLTFDPHWKRVHSCTHVAGVCSLRSSTNEVHRLQQQMTHLNGYRGDGSRKGPRTNVFVCNGNEGVPSTEQFAGGCLVVCCTSYNKNTETSSREISNNVFQPLLES